MSALRPRLLALAAGDRLRRCARAAGETWYGRLLRQAHALRRRLPPLALLLALAALAIGASAGRAGWVIFAAIDGWNGSWLWAGFAALCGLLIALVMLEVGAAACQALVRLSLRLCLDLGRHRIQALLVLLALALAALAAQAWVSTQAFSRETVALALSATLTGGFAAWFGSVYRGADRRGFRDFTVDVAAARRVQDAHGF